MSLTATSPATDSNRETGRRSQSSIRHTLKEAVDLKDLAYAAAMDLKTEDDAEAAGKKANAIARLINAWSETVEIIRIQQGKPLPGSLRPSESKPKRKVKDPVSFTPAPDCGVSTPPNSGPVSPTSTEHTSPDSTQ